MTEIILPPQQDNDNGVTPIEPEIDIPKPNKNSKVISVVFEAKKTSRAQTLGTDQQLHTTDTDAWLKFTEESLEDATGTYSLVLKKLK